MLEPLSLARDLMVLLGVLIRHSALAIVVIFHDPRSWASSVSEPRVDVAVHIAYWAA